MAIRPVPAATGRQIISKASPTGAGHQKSHDRCHQPPACRSAKPTGEPDPHSQAFEDRWPVLLETLDRLTDRLHRLFPTRSQHQVVGGAFDHLRFDPVGAGKFADLLHAEDSILRPGDDLDRGVDQRGSRPDEEEHVEIGEVRLTLEVGSHRVDLVVGGIVGEEQVGGDVMVLDQWLEIPDEVGLEELDGMSAQRSQGGAPGSADGNGGE